MPDRRRVARERLRRTVIQAHRDLVSLRRAHVPLDLATRERATRSTGNRHDLVAEAVAELVPEHGAGDTARDRSDGAVLAGFLDLTHILDRAEDAYDRRTLRFNGCGRG